MIVTTAYGQAVLATECKWGKGCLLHSVHIKERYRGKGHAKELLHRVIRQAVKENQKCIVLNVFRKNRPARKAYLRAGFVYFQPDWKCKPKYWEPPYGYPVAAYRSPELLWMVKHVG